MKPEIKEKWINALESGEYKKGEYALRESENDRYCCLGVLCDLYRKDTGNGEWTKNPYSMNDAKLSFLGENQFLPQEVQEWAGLPDKNLIVNTVSDYDGKQTIKITIINDMSQTFDPIIKIIKTQL